MVRSTVETEGFAATYIRGLEIVMQTQIEGQLREWQGPPLVLVQPRVEHISMFAFDKTEELIEAGHFKRVRAIAEPRLKANPADAEAAYAMARVKGSYGDYEEAIEFAEERVKERGLYAAHLDPELGGQGFGQVKLGLMHEILGTTPIAPFAFGNQAPDSGNSEILALAGTEEQKDRWLHPLLNGDLRSAFSMTEPETAGSDPTLLQTRATKDGDGWVIDHVWLGALAPGNGLYPIESVRGGVSRRPRWARSRSSKRRCWM